MIQHTVYKKKYKILYTKNKFDNIYYFFIIFIYKIKYNYYN